MQIYLIYFFIYAIFGWIMEVIFNGFKEGKYINCGVLNGPYCPIYGFAAVFILLAMDGFDVNYKISLFFIAMLVASVIEFVTGFILEKILGKKWWDYSDKPFNLMGHICLEYSLMFGAVGFILHEAIHPLIEKLIGFMPVRLTYILTTFMLLIFIIDLLHTLTTILGISEKFKDLNKTSYKIAEATSKIGSAIANSSLDKADQLAVHKNLIDQKAELVEIFNKRSEKRILKAFPNLIKDLEKAGYDIEENFKRK